MNRINNRVLTIVIAAALTASAVLAVLGWLARQNRPPDRADASDPQLVARGAVVYQQSCAACHGANLEGQPNWHWAILLLFQTRQFKAHWFETSTPTFLLRTLVERHVGGPALESEYASEDLLSTFEVENVGTEALLFQTGYLTITDEKRDGAGARYRLGPPNREVRSSLNASLLRAMAPDGAGRDRDRERLRDLLAEDDLDGVEALFRAFFASIPHQWHMRNDIARFEGYYASVFYSHFAGAGLDTAVEESTSRGRLDMAVRMPHRVYLFEFKVVARRGDGSALRQLKEKRYAEKYARAGRAVQLVGVEFSEAERNIVRFDIESV